MSWILLVIAGLCECGWAIGMKYTEGFTKPVPTVITVVLLVASMTMLGIAVRHLPIGTAYGVWVGIGALGTAALGIALFGDPVTPARIGFLTLLLVAIVGLKATSG